MLKMGESFGFGRVQKFQSARISVWRIPLCSSRKYDSNATDRVSIGALTNSLASVKVWSNLEKFPEILCKFLNEEDDHVSATSSTRHHPISATSSTRQRSVSNHVVATSSPRRRTVSVQSSTRQRSVSATSATCQRYYCSTVREYSVSREYSVRAYSVSLTEYSRVNSVQKLFLPKSVQFSPVFSRVGLVSSYFDHSGRNRAIRFS
ncbi:hypothetical protein LWI28_016533 [Acer negundo]|uniref:Uncharacterized protein n=1 Tax=Acer negundo TaxID=4023 RepID=A0AAD5NVC5_ACENE|nr:hypothetical protein LWI28_016533 [Acer negundo]